MTAPRPWGLPGWALVLAAFAAGFANFPLRVVGHGFDHLPGDVIDNRLNNFVLEHGYRYLTGRTASFWDAPMFYPVPRATAWSDAHLGMLPVYATFRAAGLSPEHAFVGWFLVPFALNFAAAAWAARRLGFGPTASAVAAHVFAFGLPLVGQLTHAQLFPRFFVPAAVVFAWEGLFAPRTWRLAAVAACGVAQVYVSVYIGYFLALLLAAGFLVALARFGRRLPWKELLRPGTRTWAARLAVLGVAFAAFSVLVSRHSRVITPAPLDDVKWYAPEPASWVTPPPDVALLSGADRWTPLNTRLSRVNEQNLGCGVLPVLAVLVAALLPLGPLRPASRFAPVAVGAAATLLLVALVTRFGSTWLYEPIVSQRGAGGIRVVGRVVLVLLFPAGLALGALADSLVGAVRRRGLALVLSVVLVAVAAAEHWLMPTDGRLAEAWQPHRWPVAYFLDRQGRVADIISRHPDPKIVFAFPGASDGRGGWMATQVEVMRASQDLGVPCVNGWSGYFPAGWEHFPDYRTLAAWLTATHRVPPEQLRGLVLIGEPRPDFDPRYELLMRVALPFAPWK